MPFRCRAGIRCVWTARGTRFLTDFGRATLERPLPYARRILPRPFRAGGELLRGRPGACAADLRLHQPDVVHAGDACVVQRRDQARAAGVLLPERGDGQPGRDRRALERERLAGVQGRRDRVLLGQPAFDRREGRAERQDVGRDPVHPGDGQPDAGDQPGLAAAGFGGGLSADLASGGGGVHRAAAADRGGPEPQGAEPASRDPGERTPSCGPSRRTRSGRSCRPRTTRSCGRCRRGRCGSGY